jgi:hypothetical protein
MIELGFNFSISKKRNIKIDTGPTIYGAMIYYVVRPIITTINDNYENSLTATANLTYVVSAA